ncbi:MAG TPA: DUF2905 domain-containing protein [Burkholderiales bacterium]|nr:DUF2905 domain-containing protein [Burkholderiales bacterium]
MLKWLLTVLAVLIVLSLIAPRFSRYGFGRLPGDFRVPARGRIYYIPFMSTVLLSLLVWTISRLL